MPRRGRRVATLAPALARVAELTLPSRRVSALLVLAFLGFGVLLGNVASSRVEDSLAASVRPRLKLLLPAASTAPAASAEASTATTEPPEAAAEPTPEAAAVLEPASSSAPAQATGAPNASSGAGSKGGKGGSGKPTSPAANGPATKLPAIKHVFVIMLSDEPYASVFGPASTAPYLSRTLERRGELLVRYYAVAHQQLANGIALLSGQGPTPATAANCPVYGDVAPATVAGEEQVAGEGCVYPATHRNAAGQLAAKHLTLARVRAGHRRTGRHRAGVRAPGPRPVRLARRADASDQAYATFRNPFVYFRALSDSPSCARDDVGLANLGSDLSSAKRTPSFSYIVPDRCHDASPGPCPAEALAGFRRRRIARAARAEDPRLAGLQARRAARDHRPTRRRRAANSPTRARAAVSRASPTCRRRAGLPRRFRRKAAARSARCCSRHSSKAARSARNRTTTSRCCARFEDLFGLKHLGYAAGAHVSSLDPSLFLAKASSK